MAEQDLVVLPSILVPLIEAQQTDHAFRDHLFEFVAVNYNSNVKVVSKPKLSKLSLRSWYCQGQHGDGTVTPIEVKSQDTTFGLGFQPTQGDIKENGS